jgi:hypothetical protein
MCPPADYKAEGYRAPKITLNFTNRERTSVKAEAIEPMHIAPLRIARSRPRRISGEERESDIR